MKRGLDWYTLGSRMTKQQPRRSFAEWSAENTMKAAFVMALVVIGIYAAILWLFADSLIKPYHANAEQAWNYRTHNAPGMEG